MNILHIETEKYWRGGQQQVLYLHEALNKQNFTSVLVCNSKSELLKKSLNKKLPVFEQKMLGEWDIIAAREISRLCKRLKIDIIHAHSAHALSIGIFTKLFYPKAKLVGVRRVDFSVAKNFLSKLKYNNTRVNKIVCISDFIKSVLLNDGIKQEKLTTIRSGIDILKFKEDIPESSFREKLGIHNDVFLIGTVAAFAGHKDYPNLLNSFVQVKEKILNAKLCCVGDGPLLENIKKLAKELKIENDTIFTGFRNDIGKLLKSFDLFVLASKKEGLGTSIIDAMSVGLPIIAAKSGGIPELIENGKNGIMVEPSNPQKLSHAIIELFNNQEKRKILGENALKNISAFSIETTVKKNIELYKELI